MFAVPLGLFAVSLPDELRPRAFGINAAMWGVSALIGPAARRRAHRHGRLAVGVLDQPADDRDRRVGGGAARCAVVHPSARPATEARFNMVGPVLLGLVVAVLLALTQALAAAGRCWRPLALLPAAAFFFVRAADGSSPVFTHTANSIAANVAAFGAGVAFLGAETYLPLQLQVGFDHGVRVVGIALLLCTLGWTTGSMAAARMGRAPQKPDRCSARA